MKKRLSLLLAILMLISVICIAPVSVSSAGAHTVYCINSSKWDAVSVYAWGGGSMSWPGKAMTKTGETINGYDIYSYSTDTAYTNVIFNNNGNGTKTDDLTWKDGQYYDVKAGKWYASLNDVPVVDATGTNVYLAGEFNGWSTSKTEFKLSSQGGSTGTVTLTLEANTTYKFKVVRDGKWTSNKTPITDTVSGLVFSSSVSDNASLTTTYAGNYVFTWAVSKSQLSVNYPAAPVETDPVETTTVAPAETDPVETTPAETVPAETTPAETDPVETTPEVTAKTYTAVGAIAPDHVDGGMFINTWDPEFESNNLTYNENARLWTIVYTNVAKTGADAWYEFKVATDHKWDESYGSDAGSSANASVAVAVDDSTVTIYFDGEKCWAEVESPIVTPATKDEVPTEPEVTEPSAEGYITVYFENNWKWTDVFYHSFNSAYAPDTSWGAGVVEYVATNDLGNDIYKAVVAADASILFAGTKDDGSGLDQTPDITEGLYDGVCFYMKWNNGNQVGTYNYVPVKETIAEVAGYTITLSGNIGLNFFLTFDDAVLADADAKVVFTYAGKTVEVKVADGIYDEAKGCYKYTCEVSAKDMATAISCKVVSGGKESDVFTKSVKDYAEVILADAETYAKEQSLVKAMLNYGAAAQVYFGYNTDNLANDTEYMTEDEKNTPLITFGESYLWIDNKIDGVTYYGTALSLKSETAVKHYFVIDEDVVDVESLNIYCSQGYNVEFTKNGNLYEIKVCDIPAHKLGYNLHVYINDMYLLYVPVADYAFTAQQSNNDALMEVMINMYMYSVQADMYHLGL